MAVSRLTRREARDQSERCFVEAEQGRIGDEGPSARLSVTRPRSGCLSYILDSPRNGIEGPMPNTDNGFDAAGETRALRAETRERRRRRFHPSRLDRHTHELRRWLARRGVHVAHSTVARWLRRQGA